MSVLLAADVVERAWGALDGVRDPELDESIVSLDFVASLTISPDGDADVHLRLPTYFCAPNFAFLMVADAYDAVRAVDGVRSASVMLDDHFASDAINGGVAAQAGFVGTFGDLAANELDDLRRDFLRRAVFAGTDVVCRPLLAEGRDLLTLTIGEVPPSHDLDRLLDRRRELGLPAGPDARLLIDPASGEPVAADDLRMHLGRARLSRVNIEANGSMCKGMLRSRYQLPTALPPEETT